MLPTQRSCDRVTYSKPIWPVRRGKPTCSAAVSPPPQRLAERLVAAGYVGMLVRSFAVSASEEDLNLVMWRWGDAHPTRVALVDEEGRLSRP